MSQHPEKEKPLYVVDVDLTVYDCFSDPPCLVEGSELMLRVLSMTGEVHLWSGGGEAYAREVARKHGLDGFITGYHDKPDSLPPSEEEATRILGRAADLQIDDDVGERVADWPFIEATTARKLHGSY